ncbi:MAG: glutathione S-transferase family protein [Pseudomonadota bacterium]
MKLYHAPKAVNPERVVHFLRAKGRLDTVEIEQVSIMEQEHRTDAYRALSPFAQVPVLVLDDGTAMTESRAICTYLEGLFPDPNLMGTDPKERGLIEMWDRRIEFMFMMPFAQWFRNSHPAMAPLENPQCEGTAEKAERNVKAFVKRLDDHLKDHEFVAAGRFSIADITTHLTCGFCALMRWKPHEEYEHIGAWRARMKALPFAAP